MMADELIDILTEAGEKTGKSCPKSEIHAKGHYHNTAHIWFFTKDSEILLAQRAATKTLHPLLWDVSVAGHVDAGEAIIDAAVREIKEEIGLTVAVDAFIKIGVFECFQTYENGIIDNEFHHTYIVLLETGLEKLVPQKEEVEALKLVNFDEYQYILDHIGEDNHFVPSNKPYYKKVLDAIFKQLTCY